jgi:dihydrofolate synthase/folylpolyglutamate synthase
MFQRQGAAAYKADLSGTWKVLEILGRPDLQLPHVVHVAGTNGKGSVCSAIANALQSQGIRVGLFTSPHLEDFRERLRINGDMPSEHWVVGFLERFRPAIEASDFTPSFFEWTFGMALVWFAEEAVDVVVLETGMGGRLDSTNVFPHPLVTVVTNIGLDHQQFLGNDIRSIAREKAGIIKDGSPLVMGRMRPEAQSVLLETANRCGAEVHYAEVAISDDAQADGPHWPENRATAHKALEVLATTAFGRDLSVPPVGALTKAGHAGRWQWLPSKPGEARIILDCAHNMDGLARTIEAVEKLEFDRLHVVFGAVNDKDIEGALHLLPSHAKYAFCAAQIPRALPSAELAERATKAGLQGQAFESVSAAMDASMAQAQERDVIAVLGSVFIAGEVLAWSAAR